MLCMWPYFSYACMSLYSNLYMYAISSSSLCRYKILDAENQPSLHAFFITFCMMTDSVLHAFSTSNFPYMLCKQTPASMLCIWPVSQTYSLKGEKQTSYSQERKEDYVYTYWISRKEGGICFVMEPVMPACSCHALHTCLPAIHSAVCLHLHCHCACLEEQDQGLF